MKLRTCTLQEYDAHQCVSACLLTVGLHWDVDSNSALGVVPSILIVGLLLVPLCALFSGLTLGAHAICAPNFASTACPCRLQSQ